MKFFHLADLHLGKTLHERDLTPDQEHALEAVLDAARAERPACVIMAGDIFDRAVPPTEAVRLLGRFVTGLKDIDPDLAVAIIPGNHDSAARLSFLSGVLGMAGVHVRAEAGESVTPVRIRRDGESARLWLLPFLMAGAFPVSGDGANGTPETAPEERPADPGLGELFDAADRDNPVSAPGVPVEAAQAPILRSQAELFARAMADLDAARERERSAERDDASAADILVCHAFVAGGQSGDSERAFLGTAELVDASLCAGFDYVALGHLHRPQAAGRNGRYPGSLLAYSFGDAGPERGFLSVEVKSGSFEARFIPIAPLRRMIRIDSSFESALSDPRWKQVEGDYVEALLEDADTVFNPVDALRRRFPFLLSVRQAAFERLRAGPADLPVPEDASGPGDTVSDYREFFSQMRGEAPDDEDLRLFTGLLEEVRRAADQA